MTVVFCSVHEEMTSIKWWLANSKTCVQCYF